MRLLSLLPLLITSTLAEVYPQSSKSSTPPHIIPFSPASKIPISCIQRQIDNGEHKFDSEGGIIHSLFPVCRETGESLSLSYNTPEIKECTVELTDELYHLFQLYIHQDVPFSCRLPYSHNNDDVFIPFTLNFRGIIETSHLDIDTTMNVVVHAGSEGNIVSSVGYSAGGNVSRYIIGDFMPIRLHVNWVDEYHAGDDTSHYDLKFGASNFVVGVVCLIGVVIGVVVGVGALYGVFNRKLIKNLGYKPGYSTELGIEKRD